MVCTAYYCLYLLIGGQISSLTDGYQGFYHLIGMTGEVEQTTISYIIRDHDRAKFEACEENMKKWAEIINKKYGEGTVTLELKDQYYNCLLYTSFIPSCHIREADGEIGLAVMDEVQFLTFQSCQVGVYAPFLQVTEQCRMGKFSHL